MDSMRSLNTSLPSSTPRPQPPEQLLQSFKAAALSVTNLYKNAVYEQAQAKQAGYQEAIEDLLQFLDKESLGLTGGEGSKIRQWAAERCDGTGTPSDDDEPEKQPRSTSPVTTRKEQPKTDSVRPPPKSTSPDESVSAQQQPPVPNAQVTDTNTLDRPAIFTFSAGPSFPPCQEPDVDMQSSDSSTASSQDNSPVSVSVLPRTSRQQARHNNFSRTNPRASTREPSAPPGSKRKFTVPDFFDISGLGNRDMFGGGKRGRFT
ncbi:hypothetical protein ETB97_002805 [Aspergillus alliaceus]|uniref:Uncharacterized protein n=1 Tax=Petromyces alliaceus TaxID=209559 RepID=A0A5N7CJ26_PETAA|nr:uncharacterized protein BDW43DRAFT_267672 [Aspergillus alliaceus]KAB8236142.1 hypothetical protein BDW43DRAFT_267672 [Aspergillus alliaceus]KAE8394212.1 hypothetical protein BDV23DRAFT_148127 [Aspergillus alliaceus]KAF5859504.1 hypothetical protein ETB97_002805 [Aspergillus burnettii]